jgi:hypothetical protein
MATSDHEAENPPADERTALLADQRSGSTSDTEIDAEQNGTSTSENGDEQEGYNKSQVLALSICALADPITFFCIVPFVPQMIYDLGNIKKSEVGFYAGLIVCLTGHIFIRYC